MDISELTRRGFLELAGAGAVGIFAKRAVAGPFFRDPETFPVPADKKFSAEWIESLTARGAPLTARSAADELKYIGMPVGGLCCGQVYLSGDGRLWCWDVFNLPPAREWADSAGTLYAKPAAVASPVRCEFALVEAGRAARSFDASGFRDVTFVGQYPVGTVKYADSATALRAELTAFSPFCPLEADDSSLPCTVMSYRVTNTGAARVECEVRAILENPVGHATARHAEIVRVNEARGGHTLLCGAKIAPARAAVRGREDVEFDNFEGPTYDGWTATGTAFGDKPRKLADIAGYQGELNARGEGVVNSHESRHGEDVRAADRHIGTLTSREFEIVRKFVSFRVGGGKHPGQTCVNLLIDGAPVRTSTGTDSNVMRIENWNVEEFAGSRARIEIVDGWKGEWGNIGVDDIVFTDTERAPVYDAARAPDFGSMALAVLGDRAGVSVTTGEGAAPVGEVRVPLVLAPGESAEVRFVVAWHFPNVNREQLGFITGIGGLRRHYAARFVDASAVAEFMRVEGEALIARTLLWRDTWYDSTLPCWFLERTFCNVSTGATSTCYRFDNGRFYGWEGTHCCPGTCTHVWQYAQGLARVFPEFERSLRRDIDFGAEFDGQTGLIHYRGEAARSLAIDGHCGTIVRAWREHTMSADAEFLRAVYPRVKKAMELVIARDTDGDGILDGEQYNTLDTSWYGKIAWISSLYGAALRASAAMARDMSDDEFARRCDAIADSGRAKMTGELFNGEYFEHKTDPAHPGANSTGTGCHIDQVLGQCFAWQNGLARVTEEKPTRAALQSLYRYNFAPDIGPYRAYAEKAIKGGRWYAMPGEGGLLMCTWPKGGSESATGKSGDAWAAGYFNECMTGFEHQAASHMIAEGLVHEGLAVTRMIHDRYHSSLRNPYNEVECSNHYARAMASHGSFISACGFRYHGPRGEIEFMPRVFAKDAGRAFRAPFITAEGWGTYSQELRGSDSVYTIRVTHGALRLTKVTVPILAKGPHGVAAQINLAGRAELLDREFVVWDREKTEGLGSFGFVMRGPLVLRAGESVEITGHVLV